jgi:hypothetical protein
MIGKLLVAGAVAFLVSLHPAQAAGIEYDSAEASATPGQQLANAIRSTWDADAAPSPAGSSAAPSASLLTMKSGASSRSRARWRQSSRW